MTASNDDIARAEQRLAQLEQEIEQARRDLAKMTGADAEPRFIEQGTIEEDKVDNTVAPPG